MKLLVCVDLAQSMPHLLDYSKQLAKALSASLCLLHVTDSQEEMMGYGGVFGEFPVYIDPKELRQEIAHRFRHEHQQLLECSQALKADGIDCIGLGSDFDGIGSKLEMKDASGYQMLYGALIEAGLSIEEIEKIFYKNVLRVYKAVLK